VCRVGGRLVAYAALEERDGRPPADVSLGMSRPWFEGIAGAMVVAHHREAQRQRGGHQPGPLGDPPPRPFGTQTSERGGKAMTASGDT
jgi:hypothetical protein